MKLVSPLWAYSKSQHFNCRFCDCCFSSGRHCCHCRPTITNRSHDWNSESVSLCVRVSAFEKLLRRIVGCRAVAMRPRNHRSILIISYSEQKSKMWSNKFTELYSDSRADVRNNTCEWCAVGSTVWMNHKSVVCSQPYESNENRMREKKSLKFRYE